MYCRIGIPSMLKAGMRARRYKRSKDSNRGDKSILDESSRIRRKKMIDSEDNRRENEIVTDDSFASRKAEGREWKRVVIKYYDRRSASRGVASQRRYLA